MKRQQLPDVLFQLLAVLRVTLGSSTIRDLDCCDMFAGAAKIRGSFQAAGYTAVAYDLVNDSVFPRLSHSVRLYYSLLVVEALAPWWLSALGHGLLNLGVGVPRKYDTQRRLSAWKASLP